MLILAIYIMTDDWRYWHMSPCIWTFYCQ